MERVQRESKYPDRVQIFELDLADPREVFSKCEKLFKQEKVDLCVNNGGQSMRDLFEDLDFDVCEKLLNVNCTSHISVTKAVLPGM